MSDELDRHLQALRDEDPKALAKRYGLEESALEPLYSILNKLSPDYLVRKAAEHTKQPMNPIVEAATAPLWGSKEARMREVESLRQTDAPSKASMKPPQGIAEKRKQAVSNALKEDK